MSEAISTEVVRLPVAKMQDVLLARFIGCEEAAKLGFSAMALTRISTAISEITRNVIQHAGVPGEVVFSLAVSNDKQGLRIVVTDPGKGIEQPEQFLNGQAAQGLGAGISGSHKLMDDFHIQSVVGQGTKVTMTKWI